MRYAMYSCKSSLTVVVGRLCFCPGPFRRRPYSSGPFVSALRMNSEVQVNFGLS
jgi:hypothetical protein